jgi:hypothetical protein
MIRRLVLAIVVVGLAACGSSSSSPASPSSAPGASSGSGSVTYTVTCTCPNVSINYENATHGTANATNPALPWTYAWSTAAAGDFLSLSAFVSSDASGNAPANSTITVTIAKAGAVYKTQTATGGLFTTVSVSGTF